MSDVIRVIALGKVIAADQGCPLDSGREKEKKNASIILLFASREETAVRVQVRNTVRASLRYDPRLSQPTWLPLSPPSPLLRRHLGRLPLRRHCSQALFGTAYTKIEEVADSKDNRKWGMVEKAGVHGSCPIQNKLLTQVCFSAPNPTYTTERSGRRWV